MIVRYAVDAGLLVSATPVHGAPSAQPVPHWLVVLVVVPVLWLCIAGTVLVVDGLFDWIDSATDR